MKRRLRLLISYIVSELNLTIPIVNTVINYMGQRVYLVMGTWKHINEKHPEVTLEMIKLTLQDQDYVYLSDMNSDSELYFLQRESSKKSPRFTVVIVKNKGDGLWISTSMTRRSLPEGTAIFRRN